MGIRFTFRNPPCFYGATREADRGGATVVPVQASEPARRGSKDPPRRGATASGEKVEAKRGESWRRETAPRLGMEDRTANRHRQAG